MELWPRHRALPGVPLPPDLFLGTCPVPPGSLRSGQLLLPSCGRAGVSACLTINLAGHLGQPYKNSPLSCLFTSFTCSQHIRWEAPEGLFTYTIHHTPVSSMGAKAGIQTGQLFRHVESGWKCTPKCVRNKSKIMITCHTLTWNVLRGQSESSICARKLKELMKWWMNEERLRWSWWDSETGKHDKGLEPKRMLPNGQGYQTATKLLIPQDPSPVDLFLFQTIHK